MLREKEEGLDEHYQLAADANDYESFIRRD